MIHTILYAVAFFPLMSISQWSLTFGNIFLMPEKYSTLWIFPHLLLLLNYWKLFCHINESEIHHLIFLMTGWFSLKASIWAARSPRPSVVRSLWASQLQSGPPSAAVSTGGNGDCPGVRAWLVWSVRAACFSCLGQDHEGPVFGSHYFYPL